MTDSSLNEKKLTLDSLSGQSRALSIAVVGGSISGCIVARLLMDGGHEVRVYERSQTGLTGRGGGVATSNSVLAAMQADGLLDAAFPSIPHARLRLAKRTAGHTATGRCPWGPALDMACVHWTGLFRALRKGLPDAQYYLGKELLNVHRDEGSERVNLQFADQTIEAADLVVFTDGFRSLGRRLMYPEVKLDYRGFAVWRGVLEEQHYNPGNALEDHPRLSFADMQGSFITYLMPSTEGSTVPGERIINWAAYLPVTAEELPEWMMDNTGTRREGTVPAGFFRISEENRLKALMKEQLPTVFADIVAASVDTQFQPIRTTEVPGHYADQLCLVGDSAVAIQPMTGSGLFKAYENARTLVAALKPGSKPLGARLQAWSAQQTDLDGRLLGTGRAMENALIWNTIDLASASADDVEAWWNRHIEYPPEYSYLA